MSKIQETAPEEIFLIVGPAEETDFKELSDVTWADKPIYEETAIKYVKQPKLSIPKKIAEQADKTDFDELFQRGQEEFYQWFDHEHDRYKEVVYAYQAGKALGVELVEVV